MARCERCALLRARILARIYLRRGWALERVAVELYRRQRVPYSVRGDALYRGEALVVRRNAE